MNAARRAASGAIAVALASAIVIAAAAPALGRKPAPAPPPSTEGALAFLRGQIGPSGLIDSYVEDRIDHSYTYDNALAVMAFVSAGDLASATTILDAFLAIGQPAGGFLHRYRADDGWPDGVLYAGPNAYLLQAVNLLYLETGDDRYNALARGLAEFLVSLQDTDGGLVGRPGAAWKSTENNLAALSALHNLAGLQGLPEYAERASAIQGFLVRECWDGVRFLAGKDDPFVVTDVQALGTLVLGPEYASGAYWIEGYTLNTQRYAGRNTVTGFDFNADRDTVWTEGTLQEALAFLVAEDPARAGAYTTEAEKLYQSSGALWLASNTGTTGYDWTLRRWQAVAPTAWYVLVSNQDNVLELLP